MLKAFEDMGFYCVDNLPVELIPIFAELHAAGEGDFARAALLVDGIEKMTGVTRLQSLPQAFCHEERSWYRGLIVAQETVIPVLNPEGLLEAEELSLLDAQMAGCEARATA